MDADERDVEARVLGLLVVRLNYLIQRRIPVRGVQPGPVHGATRLRMADGTTLLVRSDQPGSMARVLHAITTGRAVLVERWERRGPVVALWLGVQGVKMLHLGVVGLGPDQPD